MASGSGRKAQAFRNQSALFTPRQLAPVPDTGWSPPTEFPRLGDYDTICIDVETYDPRLKERGAGWSTGDGHIVGIAVGAGEDRWYFPMRHTDGGNLDPAVVKRWAQRELTRKGQLKVGANLMYDLGWLSHEGIDVAGPYYDVQFAEAILNEHRRRYSLDSIAKDRGFEGKDSNLLYDWCSRAFGGKADHHQRKNIYRAPVALVGPYAEGDVDQPLKIRDQQLPELLKEELTGVLDLEHSLIPMLIAMRRRGVRIRDDWHDVRDYLIAKATPPEGIDVWAAKSIAAYCNEKDIGFRRTPATNAPSFTNDWLKAHSDPVLRAVANTRKYEKACGTFLDGYMGMTVNGRLHGEFHPLRSDDGGTVSGRFSSSNPNLQNIPSRDPELGPLIRSLFVPDEGEDWAKLDYSQVEYRLLAHYARGQGSMEVRGKYIRDPLIDFHQMVADMSGLERRSAKDLNFGMVYGQGEELTASVMGVTKARAKEFREQYFRMAPFVKFTSDTVSRYAAQRGWIRSIGGRIHRFPHWEVAWEEGLYNSPEAAQVAKEKLGYTNQVRRAKTHKALNALLQGSAADIMKMAMRDIWESGVCDVLGAPLLTVHDELDWSVPRTKEGKEAVLEVKHLMEACCETQVPLICDAEMGTDWANVKQI